MIEVIFRFPDELDLAFYYLNKQFQRFEEEDILIPQHEIAIGTDEISIMMWYPDDDDSDDSQGGDDDDPIWPLPPDPIPPHSIAGVLPVWIESWS